MRCFDNNLTVHSTVSFMICKSVKTLKNCEISFMRKVPLKFIYQCYQFLPTVCLLHCYIPELPHTSPVLSLLTFAICFPHSCHFWLFIYFPLSCHYWLTANFLQYHHFRPTVYQQHLRQWYKTNESLVEAETNAYWYGRNWGCMFAERSCYEYIMHRLSNR